MPKSALWLCLALLVTGFRIAEVQEKKPEITISLEEYDRLREGQQKPSIAVIDTIQFSGTFQERNLSVEFRGRASGRLTAQTVLASPEGVSLHACEGDGVISRGENHIFQLTPLSNEFRVKCKLNSAGSDRLELTAPRSALWVESGIADGELVMGSIRDDGARSFTIVRVNTSVAEGLKPSSTGRYLISLLPDQTEFRYEIQIHNPNRSRIVFPVVLRSQEHVQQVDSSSTYDVQQRGKDYQFDLPPGDVTVVLKGTLSGTAFLPPVNSSLQYAMLESHPLLRPIADSKVRRVSPGEVGMTAQYRGAQAFILDEGQTLSWTVTRLEILRTTSFAVANAHHSFFFPSDGPILAETIYGIDNQGASDITLPMKSEPTYASLQNEPVLLTRNKDGDLWLSLAQGPQQVLVQHRQEIKRVMGLAAATIWLPRVSAPVTETTLELKYPAHWIPLYESFSPVVRLGPLSLSAVFWTLLLFLLTERVLKLLGLSKSKRLLLSMLFVLSASLSTIAAVVVWVADFVIILIWAYPFLNVRKGLKILVLVLLFGAIVVSFLYVAAREGYTIAQYKSMALSSPPVSYGESQTAGEAPKTPTRQANYMGLPARFTLPAGTRQSYFSQELLPADASRAVHAIMISQTLVWWLKILLIALSIGLLTRNRQTMWSALKNLWSHANPAPPSPPLILNSDEKAGS